MQAADVAIGVEGRCSEWSNGGQLISMGRPARERVLSLISGLRVSGVVMVLS